MTLPTNKLNCCLDTSLIIKLFNPEPDSNQANNLIKHLISHHQLIAPSQLKLEVFSVLNNMLIRKKLTQKQLHIAIKYFFQLPIDYQTQDDSLLTHSLKLSIQLHQPTIYDTIFLCHSMENHAILISADEKFINTAKTIYPDSLSLREIMTTPAPQ